MRSCSSEYQTLAFLPIHQYPVSIDVTFSAAFPSVWKLVIMVFSAQSLTSAQFFYNIIQGFQFPVTFCTSAVVIFILTCSLWYISLHRFQSFTAPIFVELSAYPGYIRSMAKGLFKMFHYQFSYIFFAILSGVHLCNTLKNLFVIPQTAFCSLCV